MRIAAVLSAYRLQRTSPEGLISGGDHTKREYQDAATHLAEWYDGRQRDFHEVYRLRPKIESLFSALKRVTSSYCWSRGRHRAGIKNADEPCVAWINETLCKLVYMNLRTRVVHEVMTATAIDYAIPERCFPELSRPVLAA